MSGRAITLGVLWGLLCGFAFTGAQNLAASQSANDHLVPMEKQSGSGATYENLWRQKLLVTTGDVARFVFLPGNVGEEYSVSVYRRRKNAGKEPADFGITLTQASGRLADCVPSRARIDPPADLSKVTITKRDLAFSGTAASKISKVWLAMLSAARPENEDPRTIRLDNSTEIFSAKNADGKTISARVPYSSIENGKTKALLDLASSLVEYCDVPASERAGKARQIEKDASELLVRISGKKTGS